MEYDRTIDLLEDASREIKVLREQVEHLTPRAEAFAALQDVLRLLPGNSQGYGKDVAWELYQRVEELKAAGKQDDDQPDQEQVGGDNG